MLLCRHACEVLLAKDLMGTSLADMSAYLSSIRILEACHHDILLVGWWFITMASSILTPRSPRDASTLQPRSKHAGFQLSRFIIKARHASCCTMLVTCRTGFMTLMGAVFACEPCSALCASTICQSCCSCITCTNAVSWATLLTVISEKSHGAASSAETLGVTHGINTVSGAGSASPGRALQNRESCFPAFFWLSRLLVDISQAPFCSFQFTGLTPEPSFAG